MAGPLIDLVRKYLPQAQQAQSGGIPPDGTGSKNGIEFTTGPGGRIFATYTDPLTGQVTNLGSYNDNGSTGSGSGSGSSFNDQLDAAKAAVSAYLQGQSLADARRLSAFQEMQKVAQFALPANATQFPGFEQGGPAHALAAQMGMGEFTPPALTKIQMNPSALAGPPPTDPGVSGFINQILGAAGARGGAKAS